MTKFILHSPRPGRLVLELGTWTPSISNTIKLQCSNWPAIPENPVIVYDLHAQAIILLRDNLQRYQFGQHGLRYLATLKKLNQLTYVGNFDTKLLAAGGAD